MLRGSLRQVIIVAEFFAGFAQHPDALFEGDAGYLARLGQLEVVDVICASHEVCLLFVASIQLLEDEEHEVLKHRHDLMVLFLELHLEIEPSELSQMTGGIRVLSAEDRSNFHNLLEARGDEHLLVELGRLREVGRPVEVLDFKDVCASLGCGTEDLGRLDEHESLLREELLEQRAHTTLDDEDGMVDFCSQVKRPVRQSRVEPHERPGVAFSHLLVLITQAALWKRTLGVLDLQRQRHRRLDLYKQLRDVDLKVLDRRALDGLLDPFDQARDCQRALRVLVAAELDHLLAQLVARRNDRLHRVEALAQVQEGELRRLHASILDPAAEGDFLVFILGDGGEVDTRGARGLEVGRADEREFAVRVLGDVFRVFGFLLLALGELTGFGCCLLLRLCSCQYCRAE